MPDPDRPSVPVTDLRVDEEGLLVRVDGDAADGPVNVLFGEQRVFAFWLERDTEPAPQASGTPGSGWRRYAWPPVLRRFLDGRVTVTLTDPVTGAPWAAVDATLGSGEGAVEVVDGQGHPLGLDKSLRLSRLFADRDAAQMAPLMDAMEVVLEALEKAGTEPFLAYGTLLGAVRDHDFIGHDSDADIGYVSRHEAPVDVVRESFQIQRRLQDMGFPVHRYSGIGIKVVAREADGSPRGLDVFGGFMTGGTLYLMGEVGHPFRREWLYPRSTVELAGRRFPAPAEPAHLLEAMYGPSWRVPDPAYQFTTPQSTQRRLSGWFRGRRHGIDERWDRHRTRTEVPGLGGPSPFVQAVRDREPDAVTAVDIGCGRGRDALWLARQGVHAVGLDYFPPDLRVARRRAAQRGVEVDYRYLNLIDLRSVLQAGADLARLPGPRVALARHVLEATDRTGREELLRLAKMVTRGSGRLHLQAYVAPTEHSTRLDLRPLRFDAFERLVAATGGRIEERTELDEHEAGVPDAAPGGPRSIVTMVVSWSR